MHTTGRRLTSPEKYFAVDQWLRNTDLKDHKEGSKQASLWREYHTHNATPEKAFSLVFSSCTAIRDSTQRRPLITILVVN